MILAMLFFVMVSATIWNFCPVQNSSVGNLISIAIVWPFRRFKSWCRALYEDINIIHNRLVEVNLLISTIQWHSVCLPLPFPIQPCDDSTVRRTTPDAGPLILDFPTSRTETVFLNKLPDMVLYHSSKNRLSLWFKTFPYHSQIQNMHISSYFPYWRRRIRRKGRTIARDTFYSGIICFLLMVSRFLGTDFLRLFKWVVSWLSIIIKLHLKPSDLCVWHIH